MSTYICLIKFTNQGLQNIKNNQKNQEEAVKKVENMGVKILGLYYLMGEYDVILIYECSGDDIAVASTLAASSNGDIKTSTLKAFKPEEFAEIISKLP